MSRTVTLLRHAKASRDDPRLDDTDRPLTDRGRRDAVRMSAWMSANAIRPDLILCSSSARTRETLALVSPGLPPKIETRFDEALYLAEKSLLLETIQNQPTRVRHVLLVGHNPGFHDLAVALANTGDRAMRASLAEKFPTCGCASIAFTGKTWAMARARTGTLALWMSPKQLT